MINKENWKENYTHISNEAIDNEKVLHFITKEVLDIS